jgi:dihydrofolate reductase
MGKLVASVKVSLDGVMEAPHRFTVDFRSDDGQRAELATLKEADALLLGRTTFDALAQSWPTAKGTGAYGEKMNSMPKYVVSSTLTAPTWYNSTVVGPDLVAEVTRIKSLHRGTILVLGSGKLLRALLREGLVDEVRLEVYPIVLGEGDRLFPTGHDAAQFGLVESRPTSAGVVLSTYRPVRRTNPPVPAAAS